LGEYDELADPDALDDEDGDGGGRSVLTTFAG
jgi:hypothetical protein